MRNKIVSVFLLVMQLTISQNILINGKVYNKEDNQPIYGAAIMMGENYIAFSDIEGAFSFDILEGNQEISITFKHLSYEDLVISFNNLKQNRNIFLTPKINSLDEVVVESNSKQYDLEEILNKGVKSFDNAYVDYPYWSNVDYKHVLYLDGKPHAFLQYHGNILMVGSKVSNPFIDASIIPNQIRRTKECELPVESWFPNHKSKSFSKTELGSSEARNSWTDFRFLELVHPLSKKGQKYFEISFNNESTENEDYFIVDFKQKKDIDIATRWLDHSSGQLWINKDDFTIQRTVITYRFEKIFLVSYDITYQKKSGKIFPEIVKKTKYNFNQYNEKKSKITISSISYFNDINTTKRENYRKKYIAPWHTFSETYDKNYWFDKKVTEPKYLNGLAGIIENRSLDEVFEEGAKAKEYNENLREEIVKDWENRGLELKRIMQKDLNQ